MTTTTVEAHVREHEAEFFSRSLIEYPQYLRREGRFVQALASNPTETPSDEDIARLALALTSIEVRDVAWSLIGLGNAADHVTLWATVADNVPRRLSAPATALLAFAAWLAGRPGLAAHAAAATLETDPQYRLAHLVRVAVVTHMPADGWEPVPVDELPLFNAKK